MSGQENKPPRKELTSGQRAQIIGAFKMGHNPLTIAKTFDLAPATVYKTVKRYQETGSENPVKRHGRPKALSDRDKRALNRVAVSDRQEPLAVITNKFNATLENDISTKTVRRYLKEMGWNSCVSCKKPFLNDKNAANRAATASIGQMSGEMSFFQTSHDSAFTSRMAAPEFGASRAKSTTGSA